jgi:hypothetical protein
MCDTPIFSAKWLNENLVNDGVSIQLKGQTYHDDNRKLNEDNLFLLDESITNRYYNDLHNIILKSPNFNYPYSSTEYFNQILTSFGEDTDPYFTNFNFTIANLFEANKFSDKKLIDLSNAVNDNLNKNSSSDRFVTCDFLYRRDIIQDIITNIKCDPRNRLCVGPPTIHPYIIDISTNNIIGRLDLNTYPDFNNLPDNYKLQKPKVYQLGSIYGAHHTTIEPIFSDVLALDIEDYFNNPKQLITFNLLTDTEYNTCYFSIPVGTYQVFANIPVEISNNTIINNYTVIITPKEGDLDPNELLIGNKITSLVTESNTTESTIVKNIQITDQVFIKNPTKYILSVKFSFSGNDTIRIPTNIESGFKFQAMRIS